MADHGDISATASAWTEVEIDSRIRIPAELVPAVPWYNAGDRTEVLLELAPNDAVIIHAGERLAAIEEQRKNLLQDFTDRTEALRRIAATRAIYLPAVVGKTNRRLVLPSPALEHLGINAKPARLFCLAFSSCIQLLNQTRAMELFATTRLDIRIE